MRKKIVMLLSNQVTHIKYDSMIKVFQSISITLFCMQINYNKYLSYIITFGGKLSFGIYLIHVNLLVIKNIFSSILKKDPSNLTLSSVTILFLVKGLKIFFICIFIDYLRNLLFVILQIRKICIFIEKKIFKIFG